MLSNWRPTINKFVQLGFVLLIGALFIVPGFVTAQEDVGSGGIGGRPAFPREDNPRSDSIFVHAIVPGNSVEDGIKVINNSDEVRTVAVYATDSVYSSGGAFACTQKVEPKEQVGSWIVVESNNVTLKPADSVVIPFTITVPEGTDIGEHNGCLVVQEEKEKSSPEQGIGLSFRTAIRTAILVPGDTIKQLEILDFLNSQSSDKITLTPSVNNSGNVSIDADVKTTLSYPFGINLTESGGVFPVLRGQDAEWNFDHEKPFWGLFVKSNLEVSYDTNTDNFLGESGSSEITTLEGPQKWIFVVPHPLAILIYLIVLALIIGTVYYTRKKRQIAKEIEKTWKNYKVKKNDDIKKIAKRRKIPWKKLAAVNKIKAPYSLDTGENIKVPPMPGKKPKSPKQPKKPKTSKKTKTSKSSKDE